VVAGECSIPCLRTRGPKKVWLVYSWGKGSISSSSREMKIKRKGGKGTSLERLIIPRVALVQCWRASLNFSALSVGLRGKKIRLRDLDDWRSE